MKKFTFTVVSLSFVVLAFVFMIDIAVTKGLQKSKDYRFEIWTDIMHDNVNADVIFLGNSRAAMHFDVSVFDSILECSSYNFGRQGLPGNLTMYPFLIYREKTDQLPKYVIYNIDFMSFSESNMPWMKNLPQVAPYVADSLLQKMIIRNGDWFDNISRSMRIPYYRYFGYGNDIIEGLLSYIFNQSAPENEQAYRGFHPMPNSSIHPQIDSTSIKYASMCEIAPNITHFIEYEVIEWCIQHNIQVILVSTPLYRCDVQRQYISNIAKYDSLLNYYINEYNLPYLDYMCDSMSFDNSNFADLVHLNHCGATNFTIKLANDLDSLGIIH